MSTDFGQPDFGAFMGYLRQMGFVLAPAPNGVAPAPVFAPPGLAPSAPEFAPAPGFAPALGLTPPPGLAPAPALAPALAPRFAPASGLAPVITPVIGPSPVAAVPLTQTVPPRTLVAQLVPSPPSENATPAPENPRRTRIRSFELVGRRPTLRFTYRAKPKGSVGRGNGKGRTGYNLQAALGLPGPVYSWLYNELKKICQRYLDMRQTVSFQERRHLMHTYKRILDEFPEFKGYDDPLWPIEAFVHVILRSSNNSFKTALKKAEKAELDLAELEAENAAKKAAEEIAAEEAAAEAEAEDFEAMFHEMSQISIAADDLPSDSMDEDPSPTPALPPLPSASPNAAPPAQAPTSTAIERPGTAQSPPNNSTIPATTTISNSTSITSAVGAVAVSDSEQAPPRTRPRPRVKQGHTFLHPASSDDATSTPAAAVVPPAPVPTAPLPSTAVVGVTPATNDTPSADPISVPARTARPTPITPPEAAPDNNTTHSLATDPSVGPPSTASHHEQSLVRSTMVTRASVVASASTSRVEPTPKPQYRIPGWESDLSEVSVTESNCPVESEDEELSQPVPLPKGKGKAPGRNGKTQQPKPANTPAAKKKVLPFIPADQNKRPTRVTKPVIKYSGKTK